MAGIAYKSLPLLAGILALGLAAWPARAADAIGLVKVLAGSAAVERAGANTPLSVGADVFADDIVTTGPDGSLGVTFRDDTTLSMGPRGRIVLDNFAFDPAGENLGMHLKLLKGTFAVISGQVAKLAPEKMEVSTPLMTIGIRGTSFLVEVSGDE